MKREIIQRINDYAAEGIPFLLVIDFEMVRPLLFPISEVPDNIVFQTPGSPIRKTDPFPSRPTCFRKDPVDYQVYRRAFGIVMKNILAGNTYLTNLTFPTRIQTDLNLEGIYLVSHARYKLLLKNEFVMFSPEIFVQIRNGKIHSFPMKGTIDAALKDARQILLEDEKELAEHVTIVDLIRNDLSLHAHNVRVIRFRYVETIRTNDKNLLQVSSEITGDLPGDYRSKLGDIICSMLPAGSISGAPKKETLRIIREAETHPRGYYTGIMGYFDGIGFDSAVMIRYIENRDGKLVYRSGGGITSMSKPRREYMEMVDKVYIPFI